MSHTSMSWNGYTDLSKLKAPTDYFIPSTMQSHYLELQNVFSPFVTPERMSKLKSVASRRTRRVLPIFESTHHSHNISAVLRTCDAFGFQDVIFVYSPELMRFKIKDSVERGSSSWLSVRRAPSIQSCIKALRASGYKIALVSLPCFSRTANQYKPELHSFNTEQIASPLFSHCVQEDRVAVVFGNEFHGVSAEWIENADFYLNVGMEGFVESLNVSVCAGILLHALKVTLCSSDLDFSMSESEKNLLLEHWLARTCDKGFEIISVKFPHLLDYFEFVKRGAFFSPF